MKLFVQIPCYNEEKTLPETIRDIPREVPGFDEVKILIADDGSTDNTIEVAKELGVDYIVRHRRNVGLAKNYQDAVDACLHHGADVIVNTDGDNQYAGQDIPKLVAPIVDGECDYVVGCRDIKGHQEFSGFKKALQILGSWVVRKISNTNIPDTTSGFRAMHRDAAVQLNVLNRFSYTLETLIQMGNSGIAVGWVPIGVNKKTRESRLFRNMPEFIQRQVFTMLRMFAFYAPIKFFALIASAFWSIAFLVGLRVIYHAYLVPVDDWQIKSGSLAIVTLFTLLGFISMTVGVLGANLAGVRQMMNNMLTRARLKALSDGIPPAVKIIVNEEKKSSEPKT